MQCPRFKRDDKESVLWGFVRVKWNDGRWVPMDHFPDLRLSHPSFLSEVSEITSKSVFELIIIYNYTYINTLHTHVCVYTYICTCLKLFLNLWTRNGGNFYILKGWLKLSIYQAMELEVALEGHKYPRRMKTEPPLYLTRKQNIWFEMRLQSSVLYPGVAAISGLTAEKENRTRNHDG